MKPKSKKSAFLTRQIDSLEEMEFAPSEARAKREQKKLLKKTRKKHERRENHREVKDIIDNEDR